MINCIYSINGFLKMSNDLDDLIMRYTNKHSHLLKKICEPLNTHFGISTFSYYFIENDGRFGIVSNYPEQLHFFYHHQLYLSCPYLTHPSFFRSGYALIPITSNSEYLEISKREYSVSHLFLILKKMRNRIEGFFFTTPQLNSQNNILFLNQIDLLQQFGLYFKREAKSIINDMHQDGYNMYQAKNSLFLKRDQLLPLSNTDVNTMQFLKKISTLSNQEQECLTLFKQGHSAQSTAAIMGLSRRTVEHYFENIKNKLNCYSKSELLEW